jgi:hypothetical protein
MTTNDLANATGVPADLVLNLFDLGGLRRHARLVRAAPMFTPDAVEAVHRAVQIADEAVAAGLSAAEALARVLQRPGL